MRLVKVTMCPAQTSGDPDTDLPNWQDFLRYIRSLEMCYIDGDEGFKMDTPLPSWSHVSLTTTSEVLVGNLLTKYAVGNYHQTEPVITKIDSLISISDPNFRLQGILDQLQAAINRLDTVPDIRSGFHGDGYNEHTNSPISGPSLASFNELMLKENCCTDELQEQLDDGWRIVACCPQASRRPDYILGRSNQLRAKGGGALR